MNMNEKEAAEWLRGDPERRVMQINHSTEWCAADAPLPRGAYYPLQPGTELSADMAWAYLSADEKRRCGDKDGDATRFRNGEPQYQNDATDWCDTTDREDFDARAPYTILPDAPGGDRAARVQRAVEAFDFGILDDDDEKLAEWAVDARDLLFMVHDDLQKSTADLDVAETTIRGLRASLDAARAETRVSLRREELERQYAGTETERLRAELAPYQLPADGEPLTLVQRAVALEAERICVWGNWVVTLVHEQPQGRYLGDSPREVPNSFWASSAVVTLYRDPTPEPRQLAFAEAWKEAEYGPQRVVATTPASLCQYEIHRLAETGPELVVRRANGSTANVRLTYEMLAATWTEVAR